jgi:hypothetical protein
MLPYLLTFFAGVVTGAGLLFVWKVLVLAAEVRRAAAEPLQALNAIHGTPKDAEAQTAVQACKDRLRWQKNLNPEWFQPVIDEVPRLVKEIASIYYPAERNPLMSPGLSQFTTAIHLAAHDISLFLKTRSIGKVIDVSANTALDAYNKGKQVVESEQFQYASKWWKRLMPVLQTVRYKSPLMWAGLAVTNVTVRTLQPAIIDLIARRAIELYSGRLGQGATPAPLPLPPPDP